MVTFDYIGPGGRWGDLTALLPFPEQVQKAAVLSKTLHCWECYLGGAAQAGYSDSKPLIKKGLAGLT